MRPHIFALVIPLYFLLGCQPSPEKAAIARQLQDYPESRVQDIYKSFCQDNLGPGHLIPDPQSARNYLESELRTFREDLDSARYDAPSIMYYPVGDQGNYVRVDLSVVLDGLIGEETYLDAFVRSANKGKRLTEEQWVAKWREIEKVIRKDFPDILDAEKDLEMIDSYVEKGDLSCTTARRSAMPTSLITGSLQGISLRKRSSPSSTADTLCTSTAYASTGTRKGKSLAQDRRDECRDS